MATFVAVIDSPVMLMYSWGWINEFDKDTSL